MLLGVATALPAEADLISLQAFIDEAQANAGAGTGSPATGSATMTLDDATNLFSWNVTWSGLLAPAFAAHFHGPALPSQNAPVQIGIGFASPSIGSTVISAAQASDLLAGLWYVIIHTTLHPPGEIRGQVSVVPEPSTLLLLGTGLATLGIRRYRTRR